VAEAVIFDLDGTLIDSAPDIHAAVARTLADEGQPPLSFSAVRSFIGNGVPALIDRVMTARGEAADATRRAELITRFLTHYEALSSDLTTVYPGVHAALRDIGGAGHPIGLCTNKPAGPARNILAAFGLLPFFPVIIGGDSLPERKPHPAPLLAAVHALGRTSAIFVGDSEVDAETAAAAAVPFVLFTEGYRRSGTADLPHVQAFSDFAALPDLLRRLSDDVVRS
jgi:phosphoglycolate phosphatase